MQILKQQLVAWAALIGVLAAGAHAGDAILISPDQKQIAPDQVKAIQILKREIPVYQAEREGVWENEVGGPLREDSMEWGFQAGYAASVKWGGTKKHYGFVFTNPRFGWVFTDLIGDDVCGGIFEGNGELIVEGVFGFGVDNVSGGTEGIALMYKHNFMTGTRFVPFVELGNGLSMNQWGIRECQSDFEFISQVGVGCQYFYNDNWAWMIEARYHHMSNAGLTDPNPGLNNFMFTTGVTRFF
jgi:hypothetical protein